MKLNVFITEVISGVVRTTFCVLELNRSKTLKLVPGPRSKNTVSVSRFLRNEITIFILSESMFALPGLSPAPLTNFKLLTPVFIRRDSLFVLFSLKKSWNPLDGLLIPSKACKLDAPKSASIKTTFWSLNAIPIARFVETILFPIPPLPPPIAIIFTFDVI